MSTIRSWTLRYAQPATGSRSEPNDSAAEAIWRSMGQLRSEKRLVIGIFLVLSALGIAVVLAIPRTYTAEAVLLLDTRRNPLFEPGSQLVAMQVETAAINSEVAAMQVSDILARTVERLNLTALPDYVGEDTQSPAWAVAIRHAVKSAISAVKSWIPGAGEQAGVSAERMRQAAAMLRLQGSLRVVNDPRTYTVRVRYSWADPVHAAAVANAIADTYVDTQREVRVQGVREARIVSRALVPVQTSGLGHVGWAAIALVGALAIALGAGLIRGKLRAGFRSSGDAEAALRRPVVGELPRIGRWQAGRRQILRAPPPSWATPMRILAASLLARDAPPRRLLVTSAGRGEGKSVAALSLAATLARAGRSCLYIDAAPRSEYLGGLLGGLPAPGWAGVLEGSQPLALATTRTDLPGLEVLEWGKQRLDSLDLLSRVRLEPFFDIALAEHSFVVVDARGVLVSGDAELIAPFVDEALLLIHWNRTPQATAARAAALLERAGRPPCLVLSQIELSAMSTHERGYLEARTP